jgi:hypothetical protein
MLFKEIITLSPLLYSLDEIQSFLILKQMENIAATEQECGENKCIEIAHYAGIQSRENKKTPSRNSSIESPE